MRLLPLAALRRDREHSLMLQKICLLCSFYVYLGINFLISNSITADSKNPIAVVSNGFQKAAWNLEMAS